MEVKDMSTKDERDVLELLKAELDHIEKGGYGRSVRTPWRPTSVFQDSLTCLNFGYPYRAHPCNECFLDELAPPEQRAAEVPCHHIPLDAEGTTVEEIESEENQQKLEEKVKVWLRAKIKEIEDARALSVQS
ncbi:MAG: hypothetical protein DMF65_04585 [Acidobacteria bacterium]|nr:MAG: hypothetical protein DMF65_04585 [Acidobacteriota bacterium]